MSNITSKRDQTSAVAKSTGTAPASAIAFQSPGTAPGMSPRAPAAPETNVVAAASDPQGTPVQHQVNADGSPVNRPKWNGPGQIGASGIGTAPPVRLSLPQFDRSSDKSNANFGGPRGKATPRPVQPRGVATSAIRPTRNPMFAGR